ncbi:MAG: hypothetical protein IPM54_19665 [Polyangiaceae bacterium]|nr:hypothetical protein [Polyangiaceae bacterium]
MIAAGVGRETKRTSKKVDTAALSAAMRDGQGARLQARSVLGGAKRTLLALGNIAAVQKIEALLERDSVAAEDAEGLAKQLDALQDVLKDPAIADAAKGRGGPKAVTDLAADAQALRDASKAKAEPRGTPVETGDARFARRSRRELGANGAGCRGGCRTRFIGAGHGDGIRAIRAVQASSKEKGRAARGRWWRGWLSSQCGACDA